MTYKTRQEVLRAAADWIDVCEAAGVEAKAKNYGELCRIAKLNFNDNPESYEFPLALLEGKEVWVGSELYGPDRCLFIVERTDGFNLYGHHTDVNDTVCFDISLCSWNSPKPATVMVEMLVEDAELFSRNIIMTSPNSHNELIERRKLACKKALENLK